MIEFLCTPPHKLFYFISRRYCKPNSWLSVILARCLQQYLILFKSALLSINLLLLIPEQKAPMDVPYATPDEIQSWTTPSSLTSPSSTTSLSTSGTTSPSYWSSTESTSSSTETPITPFTTGYDYFSDVGQDEYIVAIVGIGYVGIHLVAAFSKHYKVIAFDINEKRIADMAKQFADMPNVYLTSDASLLTPATHLLVAVPTPLIPHTTKTDTSIIRNALETICSRVRRGATIIIESSVSVGMTRSLLGNMMKTYHINAGMSPEVKTPPMFDMKFEYTSYANGSLACRPWPHRSSV